MTQDEGSEGVPVRPRCWGYPMRRRILTVALAAAALAMAGCDLLPRATGTSGGALVEVVGPGTPVDGAIYAPGPRPTHLPPAYLPPPQPE
jgi:hypothetical protein